MDFNCIQSYRSLNTIHRTIRAEKAFHTRLRADCSRHILYCQIPVCIHRKFNMYCRVNWTGEFTKYYIYVLFSVTVVIMYINCYSVNLATSVMNVFTAAKLIAILIVIVGGAWKLFEGKLHNGCKIKSRKLLVFLLDLVLIHNRITRKKIF